MNSLFYSNSNKPIYSILLVVIQFFCIFYILFSDRFYPTDLLLIMYFAGIFLGFWAIYVMRKAKLNILPDVIPGTQVINQGPYKIIRHPMYLANFITLLPLVIEYYSIYRVLAYLLLIVNQVVKMTYEEKMLLKVFDGYREYKKSSWRLIPLVY